MIQIISQALKEPLRSIGTYSDMLFSRQKEDFADKSFDRLKNLKRNASRLKKMLDEVSSLAHVTASPSPEVIEVPELTEVIKCELRLLPMREKLICSRNFPGSNSTGFSLKFCLRTFSLMGKVQF